MKLRSILLICVFSACSVLSWGTETWHLTPTMKAYLSFRKLYISTTATSEAMPNFSQKNPAPWNSFNGNYVYTVENVRINGNITSIGNYAFAGCKSLKTVEIQDNLVASIGNYAFTGCTSLTSVDIPNSVTSIGKNAFEDCTSLTSVDIPNLLKTVGNGAFQGCTGIRTIWVKWETPLDIPNDVFASINTSEINLKVPKEVKSSYETAKVWKTFNIQEEEEYDYERDHRVELALTDLKNFVNLKIGEKALTLSILILSVILFTMRAVKEKGETRRGATFVVSNTLFLTVCLLEILYHISIEDHTWFCRPGNVGWLWTVVNFILFAGIVFNQILYFWDVIRDVFSKKRTKKITGFLFAIFIFLLGAIGTFVTVLAFLEVLIIVAIGVIFLAFLSSSSSKNSGSESSSSSSSSSFDDTDILPYAYCFTCKYYPGAGRNCSRKKGEIRVNDNSKACMYWERG